MNAIDPLLRSAAKATGKRPYFLDSKDNERTLNILMAVLQEVAVMRERMDTIERVLDKKGVLTRADIEGFTPTKAEAAERGLLIQQYLNRTLRILQQEQEALSADDQLSEDVADELAKP
jgi:hypothetical protein